MKTAAAADLLFGATFFVCCFQSSTSQILIWNSVLVVVQGGWRFNLSLDPDLSLFLWNKFLLLSCLTGSCLQLCGRWERVPNGSAASDIHVWHLLSVWKRNLCSAAVNSMQAVIFLYSKFFAWIKSMESISVECVFSDDAETKKELCAFAVNVIVFAQIQFFA